MVDKEIYTRMDLDKISTFILDGEGNPERGASYDERLQKGIDPIYKRLEQICGDTGELNEAVAELYKALNSHGEVYMEVGMKAGARLLYQLLFNCDPKPASPFK